LHIQQDFTRETNFGPIDCKPVIFSNSMGHQHWLKRKGSKSPQTKLSFIAAGAILPFCLGLMNPEKESLGVSNEKDASRCPPLSRLPNSVTRAHGHKA
jgi:hypothetical protein